MSARHVIETICGRALADGDVCDAPVSVTLTVWGAARAATRESEAEEPEIDYEWHEPPACGHVLTLDELRRAIVAAGVP
jgi:hypothetical protein